MFKDFESFDVPVNGTTLHGCKAGAGPALLLLHGHPQSHVMWHRVAPALASGFTVICVDLPGYGDSKRHAADPTHLAYAKRTMAADLVGLMGYFGFETFRIAAHDRGARVAHRLALDYPDRLTKLLFLDIAPTLAMYENTSDGFARAYWHWFFLIQPAPLPERLIEADPVAYLRDVMGCRHAGLAAFSPEAWAEYARCIAIPGTATAICEDYRASASIDLDHDRADRLAGHRIRAPLRVLWGSQGAVGKCFDVLSLWEQVAHNVTGRALDCGHYIAEESPEVLLEEMQAFFR